MDHKELARQLQERRLQKQRDQDALLKARQEVTELKAEQARAAARHERRTNELLQRTEKLSNELAQARMEVAQLNSTRQRDAAEGQEELRQLRGQVTELLDELERTRQETAEVSDRLTRALEETTRAEAQVEELLQEARTSAQKEAEQARRDAAETQNQLQAAREELEQLCAQGVQSRVVADANRRAKAAEMELARVTKLLNQTTRQTQKFAGRAQATADELRAALANAERNVRELTVTLEDAQRETQRLRRELARAHQGGDPQQYHPDLNPGDGSTEASIFEGLVPFEYPEVDLGRDKGKVYGLSTPEAAATVGERISDMLKKAHWKVEPPLADHVYIVDGAEMRVPRLSVRGKSKVLRGSKPFNGLPVFKDRKLIGLYNPMTQKVRLFS